MDKEIKKQVLRVFYSASFLFISIVFVLPYLVQITTYFHEKAHIDALNKYEIRNYYQVNLLETIPNFFNPKVGRLGVTKFDFDKYQKLSIYEKAEINLAGIISDLKFLFLVGVYLSFMNLYIFYRIRIKRNINFSWVLAINWILFMWLISLIQITIANISYSSGDVYQLVKAIGR